MAMSRCPRSDCSGTAFELKEFEPRGSHFKYLAVQCTSCGAVAGVVDFYNVGSQLRSFMRAMKIDPDDLPSGG